MDKPGSSPVETAEAVETKIQDGAVAPVDTKIQDGKPADSSAAAATTPKKAETMLDAVNAALKPKEVSPTSKTPGQVEDADPDAPKQVAKDGEPSEEEGELSEDELKAVGQKVQRRFKTLSTKLAAKDTEIASLVPKAKEYDKIAGFIQTAGMDNNEVGELLTIGALLKRGDHRGALSRILPVVQALQKAAGEELSPELQERVARGLLTEEDAKALSRSAADAESSKRQLGNSELQRKAEAAARETKAFVDKTLSAVEAWEKQQKIGDPDWHLKQAEVSEQVSLAILTEQQKRGHPWFPTDSEAIELSKTALKTVNTRLKRFQKKPGEVAPDNQGGPSTRSKAQPKTMREVIDQGLAAGA